MRKKESLKISQKRKQNLSQSNARHVRASSRTRSRQIVGSRNGFWGCGLRSAECTEERCEGSFQRKNCELLCWMFLAGCAMVMFIEGTIFFLITTLVAVGLQYQGALGPADATMFSAKLMWCNYWTFAQSPIILEPTPTNQPLQ